MRDDVLCFRKISGPQILCWDKITRLHQNTVRRYVMNVPAVIVRCRTVETSREWIDPGTRADASLAAVQTGAIRIRAAGAKMAAAYAIASE